MSDTLARLFGPTSSTGSDQIIYTVPSGKRAVLRDLHIVNEDTLFAEACKLSIGADAAGTRILPTGFKIPSGDIFDLTGDFIFNSGEVIHWNGETNNLMFVGSGFVIDDPDAGPDVLKRIGPVAGSGSLYGLYSVPVGNTLSIRNIHIANNDSVARSCTVYLGAAGSNNHLIPQSLQVPPNGIATWKGLIVMNGAEALNWNGNSNLTLTVNTILQVA
jgi:hypothetical protein